MTDFVLKRYKIVKDFNGYKKGQIVAFSGADADKYADKICSLKVAKPLDIKKAEVETKQAPLPAEEVKEVKEEVKKVKRTYKRKK